MTECCLFQKNDQEKTYLKIQKSHASQQVTIQKLNEKLKKMKKLEEVCKKQENVIQQMERVLEKHHRDRSRSQRGTHIKKVLILYMDDKECLFEVLDEAFCFCLFS